MNRKMISEAIYIRVLDSNLMQRAKLFAYINNNIHDKKRILQDKQFHLQLKSEQSCFPYGERSDVPRLQQVEQKAVGRQRNLGLFSYIP
jgi:hypothetical protein